MTFCFSGIIWLIMSAKRTYAEVVSGDEKTPDDGHSWMRAYQDRGSRIEDRALCLLIIKIIAKFNTLFFVRSKNSRKFVRFSALLG